MNLRLLVPISAVAVILAWWFWPPQPPLCGESLLCTASPQQATEILEWRKESVSMPAIILGIADDISGSSKDNGIKPLTINHLKPAIDRIERTGGEIALATISDLPEESLIRLRVLPRPILPSTLQEVPDKYLQKLKKSADKVCDEVPWTERDACRKTLESNRKELLTVMTAYKQQFAQWKDETKTAIGEFTPEAEKRLSRKRGGNSDVCTPLNRLALFLQEPRLWLNESPVMQALVLNTDGEETVRPGCGLPELPRAADVTVANGGGKTGALSVYKPKRFDSFDAALDAVIRKKVSTLR